jgi:hypothetical protein
MRENNTIPGQKEISKGTELKPQIQRFYDYLLLNIATCSMVTEATGIPQKNLCRYKRELEKMGVLCVMYRDVCRHTGCKAGYLTTNPQIRKKYGIQLSLFDDTLSATGGATT